MTRNILATTALTALLAAPVAFADEATPLDIGGDSPEITHDGGETVVGSTDGRAAVATERPGIGIAEYDPTRATVTEAEFDVLRASPGADFETQDGVRLGVVQDVMFDAQGNPEMVVNLLNDTQIEADTLVVTLLPGSFTLVNNALLIDTTADELYLKAQQGAKRNDENRTTVIVM
ncbi:MAG: hypothetical protein P1U53_06465 [Sulfitobacter sp.]|nr:hypothetical protein [Sulfitobacter sp.]